MVRVWEAKGNIYSIWFFLNVLIKTQRQLHYIKLKRVDLDSRQNGIAARVTLTAVTRS